MDIIQNGSRVLVPLRILEQNIMAHAKSTVNVGFIRFKYVILANY